MALAIHGTTTARDETVSSLSFSHDSGSGADRLLVVHVGMFRSGSPPTITGVTYNGVALTLKVAGVHSYAGGGNVVRSEQWYLENPAAGSNTVVITASGTADNLGGIATTYTDAGGVGENTNTQDGNLSAYSMAITTAAASSQLHGGVRMAAARSVTAGTGVTLLGAVDDGTAPPANIRQWAGWKQATGGSDTWEVTLNSSVRSCGSVIEILEADAGGGTDELTATGIATAAPTVGSATLAQTHSLTATGTATGAPTAGSPALAQTHDLAATGIVTGQPETGTPALAQAHELTATGLVTGAPSVDAAAIAQTHALSADGIVTGSPTVDSATLTQSHTLVANGVTTGTPTLGTPGIASDTEHFLTATGVVTGSPTVGNPALAQVHSLTATGLITGVPSVDSATLGQAHQLTAEGVTAGVATLGQPELTELEGVDVLTAVGIATEPPTVGTPALGQIHSLTAAAVVTGAPTLGNPALFIVGAIVAHIRATMATRGIAASLDTRAISTTLSRRDIKWHF